MAIVFPRPVPGCAGLKGRFDLVREVSVNQRRGKPTQVIEKGDARWHAQLTTGPLERADYQTWRAWWDSFRGGLRDMLLHDPAHPYPIDYRTGFDGLTSHGGGAFTGDGNVDALTTTTVTISGLPSTFSLRAGDYVGLSESGKRALHRVQEDAVAAAGIVTLSVEPFVKTNIFSAAATAHFAKPPAIFMAVPNSAAFEFDIGPRPFSFEAIQRLY